MQYPYDWHDDPPGHVTPPNDVSEDAEEDEPVGGFERATGPVGSRVVAAARAVACGCVYNWGSRSPASPFVEASFSDDALEADALDSLDCAAIPCDECLWPSSIRITAKILRIVTAQTI